MGSQRQRVLLEEEGILFDDQGSIDLSVFGWDGVLFSPVKNELDLI
jgi:alkylated DNA nucleotide flippase Atl1